MSSKRTFSPSLSVWGLPLRAVLCLTLLLAGLEQAGAEAQPRHSVPSRARFLLDKEVSVLSEAGNRAYSNELAQWLRSEQVAASSGYSRASRQIVFRAVSKIQGAAGDDAFQVVIKSKTVQVYYTSDAAAKRAIQFLQQSINRKASPRYFPGGTFSDWRAKAISGQDGESFVDGATAYRSVAELSSALKQRGGRGREVYLTLVSPTAWRFQSPALEIANPNDTPYPADRGIYTVEQQRQLAATCKADLTTLIPTFELLTPNPAFEAAFGHRLFSVEGMRLVRATLEDCIRTMHPAKICLGTLSPEAEKDPRYVDFVSSLGGLLGVELVILK